MKSEPMSSVNKDETLASLKNNEEFRSALLKCGVTGQFSLSPVTGGGNNRLYAIETNANKFLLKRYFRPPRDLRNRRETEFAFSTFLWNNGIRCIPKPLDTSEEYGWAMYEFIEGKRPIEVTDAHVNQGLDFFIAINTFRSFAESTNLPEASEACFSIHEHVSIVEKRIDRLKRILPSDEIDKKALLFASEDLWKTWQEWKHRIYSTCDRAHIDCSLALSRNDRILSPSDFGFHNALQLSDGTLRFVDFEYAGWDDPAKTVGDFFNQVSIPVPLIYYEQFVRSISALVHNGDRFLVRSKLLFPLYRIKWCCIVLNHFVPVEAERRHFADQNAGKSKVFQLEKAHDVIGSLPMLEKEFLNGIY
jgi:thiamine kinase-like enzyme